MDPFQWIGFLGMIFIIAAYGLSQFEVIAQSSWRYLLLTLCGAVFLLISLTVHFNLGSFLIQVFWIAIALAGMLKKLRDERAMISKVTSPQDAID